MLQAGKMANKLVLVFWFMVRRINFYISKKSFMKSGQFIDQSGFSPFLHWILVTNLVLVLEDINTQMKYNGN